MTVSVPSARVRPDTVAAADRRFDTVRRIRETAAARGDRAAFVIAGPREIAAFRAAARAIFGR